MKPFFKLFFFLASIIPIGLYGQETQWEQGELEDVEIEIVNERQITLPKANRNFEKVPPRPTESIKQPFTYDFRPFNFQAGQINPSIKPLKIKQEESTKVYGGYLSAGYGNFASPYLEGFINSRKDRNKLIGAHGLFSSSDKGPVDGVNSGSGLSKVSVYGKSFNEYVSLSGDIGFENRSTHFYGYPQGTNVEARDIKQAYNTIRIKAALANANNSDFAYNLGVGFSHLADKFEASESAVDLDFGTSYKFGATSAIAVQAGYYLLNRKDAMVDADPRSLFFVTPRYQFSPLEGLRLSVGMTASLENDSIDSKNVHVYPDIRVTYPVTPSIELVASLTGGIEKVSLHSLSNENIWVAANIPIFHTNKLYDLQAAMHTKIGNKVSLNAGLSIAALKNWYFFVNDPYDQSKFLPAYDDGETSRTNFFASLGFSQAENVNVLVRGDFYSYGTDEFEHAWHRPTYKATIDGSFNIMKKLLLDVSLITQGGAKALDFSTGVQGVPVTLDAAVDLNARVEYMVSERFSVFAQFNNLTNNEYPLFFNYPVRGFQALGGLTWSF